MQGSASDPLKHSVSEKKYTLTPSQVQDIVRSFRPGSKVNQARPGTQGIHLPQGVALHRSARSPDFAAVQLALHLGSGPREAGAKSPGPGVPSCCCRDGGGRGVTARLLLPPPRSSIHFPAPPGTTPLFSWVLVPSTPSNLNSPQQGDLGGQGLRHGPSTAPQAAQAVREGPRSSGSHSRLARRCGAAHPVPPSTTGGRGARRRPRDRDPPSGRAPALSGPLASKFKLPAAGGSRGPGPPPRPQRGTASRRGGQGGLPVLRVTLVPCAPVRRRSPRVLLHDRRGGGVRRQLSPPLSPRQSTSSGPPSPPQIRRVHLAAAAILSSSSRGQPGRRMRASRRLSIDSPQQTSLRVPGTPGRHVQRFSALLDHSG
ncbi:hypothetical protein NDU88_001822 [Pleurodeles waltl]|uniref:Uncharacterized protein n=1 Tax=Pleurodeles waltl TaxID=8319 RepID=A0AAV7UTU5_PLEWA|nr:hypothetical protein NDU88_001822 [Pleurodeles waltl]